MRKKAAMDLLRSNILIFRTKQGLSQNELASLANVSRQTISKIESGDGNVTVAILERIAAVFKCEVKDLFDETSYAQTKRPA